MEKLTNVYKKHTTLIQALSVNILIVAFCLLTSTIKYETSDDYMMQLVVSGTLTNSPSSYIQFMNPMIGLFLSTLYKITTSINWYFWCQLLSIFTCLTILSKYILDKLNVIVLALFLFFFAHDLYMLMQFTKTATLLVATGMFFFYEYFHNEEKDYKLLIVGFIFTLIGIMTRRQSIFIVIPFVGLTVLYDLFVNRKSKKLQIMFKRMIIVLGCIGVSYGVSVATKEVFARNNPEYQEYLDYSAARANIVDYGGITYSEIKEYFGTVNFSEIEYNNLIHWNFADSEVYDIETLKDIGSAISEVKESKEINKGAIATRLYERAYWKYLSCMGIVLIGLMAMMSNIKLTPILFIEGIMSIILIYMNAYMGRLVYRVEYAVFLALIIQFIILYGENGTKFNKIKVKYLGIATTVTSVALVGVFFLKTTTLNNTQIMFNSLDNSVYRYYARYQTRDNELLDYTNSDKDSVYFLGFQTTIQKMYLYENPVSPPRDQHYENSLYFSGVDTMHPTTLKKLDSLGIENPMKSLLDENVYLVENLYQEEILQYLKEHFGCNIEMYLIYDIDGYNVWKYVK